MHEKITIDMPITELQWIVDLIWTRVLCSTKIDDKCIVPEGSSRINAIFAAKKFANGIPSLSTVQLFSHGSTERVHFRRKCLYWF